LSKNKKTNKVDVSKNKDTIIKEAGFANIDFVPKTEAGRALLD
jgi:hypothetical protein